MCILRSSTWNARGNHSVQRHRFVVSTKRAQTNVANSGERLRAASRERARIGRWGRGNNGTILHQKGCAGGDPNEL
jgi:hypothetical protein